MLRNFSSTAYFEIRGWDSVTLRKFTQRNLPEMSPEDLIKLAAQLSLDYYRHPNGDGYDNLQDSLEDILGYSDLTEDDPDSKYEEIERLVQVYVEIIGDFANSLDREIETILNSTRIPLKDIMIHEGFSRGHMFGVVLIDLNREVW